ncbi:MATE family efflux transporter [Litorimonas taeanensis]|nr:MATE family efflux transporter [Litorimonas taeanensis]
MAHIMNAGHDIKAQETAKLPDTWRGEMGALLRLGIPMALTQLVQFSIYFVDAVMIGRLSPVDIAAVGIGSIIVFLMWMIGGGPAIAVSPLASQALGADVNDTRDVRRTVRMGLWAVFGLTPLIFAVLFLTKPVALALGQDPEATRRAQTYVFAVGIGLPFTLGTLVLRNFLAALDKTLIPFIIIVLVTLLNAFFNAVMIFGLFGFPRLELIGAGLASTLSAILGFGLFIAYIQWDSRAKTFDIFKNILKPDWERLKDVVRLGWPISVTMMFEGMLFNAGLLIVGVIGVIEQAAYQIGLNIASLAFMLSYGMSMAGAVRIGLARGAGNLPAQKRAATTTIIASIFAIGIFAVPMAITPETIAALYLDVNKPENQKVMAFILTFVPIAAAFAFFDAAQVACNQLLRGLKDVNWTMFLTGVSYWVIGFPVAYYLAFYTPLGARGVWYGLMAGLIAAFIALGIRLVQQLRRDQALPSTPR